MTIQIYDGMAVLRRRFDTDLMGRGPRNVFLDMLNLPATDVAIWCFEGRQSLAERRAIYEPYKVRPSTLTDGIRSLIDFTRDVLKHTKAIQVAVERREADDVVAHLCQTYGTVSDVVVHTIDKDLKALEGGRVKVDCDPLKNLEPRHVRLYKTLVGDQSDKIPGMKGFGLQSFQDCKVDLLQEAMNRLLHASPRPEDFVLAGVKEPMARKICEPANVELLTKFWRIIGFMPLPNNWEADMIVGKPDFAAGDAILREFMH